MKLVWTKNKFDVYEPALHHEPYIGPTFKDGNDHSASGMRKPDHEFVIAEVDRTLKFEDLIKMEKYQPPKPQITSTAT